ncbi:MAG: hypothetical protein IPK07_29750 [Deltaproteobacteria bacterium]|nr:hypothetical protein [Deltaproteobacteria bacterium]
MLFTVSGDVVKPGVYEMEAGRRLDGLYEWRRGARGGGSRWCSPGSRAADHA